MKTTAEWIKSDPRMVGPYVLVRTSIFAPELWEVRGNDGQQRNGWFTTFNGNSKQRRQQQRKLIRDLNK